jgi:hypothetical protein
MIWLVALILPMLAVAFGLLFNRALDMYRPGRNRP